MQPQSHEKSIFLDAMELSSPSERAALLDRACGKDHALRARVEVLLRAHAQPQALLDDPQALAPAGYPAAEGPGSIIGPYKLLQQIGEGGMGTVFMAEQTVPVKRTVALKIIKPGMDSKQVIARFEAERQALALMDHPNIAKVLDGGATPAAGEFPGRPFFVMELVKGIPITQYCDQNQVTPSQRLELFLPVCQAVQHAHQKGLIHRDLKPSNVLVAEYDDRPVVKIIDFGVAKAIGQNLTDRTLFTEFGQLLGTLEYMSPEQAKLNALDVDTRSDIYTLGVLLYELLTGTTPLGKDCLRQAAFDEVLRIIREDEPPKPSTRLSNLGKARSHEGEASTRLDGGENLVSPTPSRLSLALVAAQRRIEPGRLTKLVTGDLDWIVMKCLEKDRNRRYETANGLAMDVQRYLAGEAVLAAPPGAMYRVGKFVSRHRAGVVAGLAIAMALLLGVIGTTTGLVWSIRAARTAEAQRDKAQRIAEFMGQIFQGVGPFVAQGRDTTMLRELMDTAARRIRGGELTAAPEAEIQLRITIGDVYRQIDAWESAEAMLGPALALARKMYGEEHEQVAAALFNHAWLIEGLGQVDEALRMHQAALAMRRRLFEGDHPDVATSLSHVAFCLSNLTRGEEALSHYEEALAMQQRLFPGDHAAVAESLTNTGLHLQRLGRSAEALPRCQAALEMTQRLFQGDHPSVALGMGNVAYCLQDLGRAAEALPLCVTALEMHQRLYKADGPDVARDFNNVGRCLHALGRFQEALPMFEDALAMSRRILPAGHVHIAIGQLWLGDTLAKLGRYDEAEPQLTEASQRLIGKPDSLPRWQIRVYKAMVGLWEARHTAEPGQGYDAKAHEWTRRLADYEAEQAKRS